MFQFEPCDDGLICRAEDGRTVARIDTQAVTETNNPNLKVQEKSVRKFEKESRAIHFTGHRLTADEVLNFLDELSKQE